MNYLLEISTKDSTIRSEAIGWTFHNFVQGAHTLAAQANERKCHPNQVPVGLISTHSRGRISDFAYPTVLHAILDGWTLLSPPRQYTEDIDGCYVERAEWWLTK
jgi:hypothetical protein